MYKKYTGNKQVKMNIHDEWEEIEVGKIFDFLRSYAVSRENLVEDTRNDKGVGNIHYGDIHAKFNATRIDLSSVSVPMAKDDSFFPNKKDILINGDLLMADTSEDYEGIGIAVLVTGLRNKKVVGGLHTFVLRDNKNKTDQNYRQYIFRNPATRNKLQKIANGVSVYGISKTSLSKVIINLPPLSEQRKIRKILEAWDRAIEKLGEKIEIKKRIKKGLMQELLTGKTRLPGFAEEWRIARLGDLALNLDNKRIPINSADRESMKGDIPYCGANGIVDYINKYIFDEDIILVAEDGGQFGEYENRPIAYRMKSKCWVNNHAHVIKARANFSQDLLFFLTVNKNILISLSGGTRVKLNKSELMSIKYFVPKDLKEQKAIADILVAADEEIEGFEKKLVILKAQKRFLLNNLMTGEIRTPEKL